MSTKLSAELRLKLLRVARQSLKNFLKNRESIQFSTEIPELLEKRAVFITLRGRRNKDLRGCIGQSSPRYPLIEAVAKTSISSALDDTRFPSITIDELPEIIIEINVLSSLEPAKLEDVEIGKHGLLVKKGSKGALFLPEVAVSNSWDLHTFFKKLCLKADLPKESWNKGGAELYVFDSEAWNENDFTY